MRNFGTLSRFALVGVVGSLAGACSETVRFSNPFASSARVASEPPMTGSVSPQPKGAVESQPLAAPAAPVYNRPAAPAPIAQPAPKASPTAPRPAVATGPAGWSAQGGAAVTVRAGDNLNSLSTRYNVPPAAILSANGLKSAAQIAPGRQIVIPVYHAGATAAAPARSADPKTRVVEAPKVHEKPGPAKAPTKPEPQKPLAQKPEPQKQVAQKTSPPIVQPIQKEPLKQAQTEVPKAAPSEPPATGSIAPPQAPAQPAVGFRWPAKGRVIAGFGGASANEGINIALPEGTPVKAAEDGTVAYAGSDVKGYGKLVLIRHDNGYVSAYAHNGEIAVKHGEKVKRGQAIAKSGQSGNVTSPQLHFEIRKGAQPVDPMPHLQGG